MKIEAALKAGRKTLTIPGIANPGMEATILLAHTCTASKEWVIFNPEIELNTLQEEKFFALISRRKEREPISHLISKREFFGQNFLVSPDVLDPRPDSEILIELALKTFPNPEQKIKILELGVGSGCLIITLLLARSKAVATGVDFSAAALKIAKQNSFTHKVESRLNLIESNLFTKLNSDEKFELIISNPPYIPSAEITKLEPEVRIYEPLMALDGGKDGLDFYRLIAVQAKKFLATDGIIIVEIGIGQKNDIEEIFKKNGLKLIEVAKDLAGIERTLSFQ